MVIVSKGRLVSSSCFFSPQKRNPNAKRFLRQGEREEASDLIAEMTGETWKSFDSFLAISDNKYYE